MKQYRIDNSERERILNLHESATKRQYLSEQKQGTIKDAEIDRYSDEVKNAEKFNINVADDGISVAGVTDLKGKQFTKDDVIKFPDTDSMLYFNILGDDKGYIAQAGDNGIIVYKPMD